MGGKPPAKTDWVRISGAYADTVFYFVAMVLSVLLWTRFVIVFLNRENIFGKLLQFAAWAIFAAEIVVLIINFFTPIARSI